MSCVFCKVISVSSFEFDGFPVPMGQLKVYGYNTYIAWTGYPAALHHIARYSVPIREYLLSVISVDE